MRNKRRSDPTQFAPSTIDAFMQCVTGLAEAIVLDGIVLFPDNAGFLLWSHDMYGPLPEIVIAENGDRLAAVDEVSREACKLVTITRIRDELMHFLPGSILLPPTSMDGKGVVGMKAGPEAFLAEGGSFLEAYQQLRQQLLELIRADPCC